MPGAGLTSGASAKALSDRPAFQPDWGKPAVRNDREDDGNIGIIRSPISAIVLPDHHSKPATRHCPTRPAFFAALADHAQVSPSPNDEVRAFETGHFR